MSQSNLRQLWKDILQSIAGNDLDFTNGSLNRAILVLSIPMVLEMIMESVFAIVDIFFVSKLGADAVAAVGITESLMTLVYAFSVGLSMGTTALVSRRIGEKNKEKAAESASQALYLAIVLSLLISIPGIMYGREILSLMGGSDSLVETGHEYTSILLGTNVIIMFLFIINAIFRSAGDAAISMRVLWVANIINIILDPCLIFGLGPFPELGVKGAAIATTTGRGVGVLYQFYLLGKGTHRIRFVRNSFLVYPRLMWQLLKLSANGMGQSIIATSSWIGMVRIISMFGSEVVAGYTIAIRIIIFSLLPSWGLSNATATLVGQNLGAKKPDRAEKSVWVTGKVNMIFLGVLSIIFIIVPDFFIGIFINDPVVIEKGALCLKIVCLGFILYALGMVMIQAFNGAGDTATPFWINLFCFWMLEIPLAYLLAVVLGWAETGVYTAIVFSESMMAIIGIILFRRGRWKLKEV